jgi:hypothetical protein
MSKPAHPGGAANIVNNAIFLCALAAKSDRHIFVSKTVRSTIPMCRLIPNNRSPY